MFYELAETGKEPTPFQLARLRSYEVISRMNSIIYEGFDLGTDIAFMLVLFDQSQRIQLPAAWDFYKATTACPGIAPGGDPEFYFGMAIASAFFIALSCSYRLFASIYSIATKEKEITGTEWLWVLLGTTVSMVDPWNGALMINQVMEKKRLERNDYILAVSELKSDSMLLLLENIPQLVIQIIYGVYTGQIGFTSVAWFVTLFMTLFHMATQIQEIIFLARQLPELLLAYEQGKSTALVSPES